MGRLVTLAFALLGLATAGCLPKPHEPVEWLRREDSVIVQVRTAGGLLPPGAAKLQAPELTLYGDGTLIYTAVNADGRPAVLEGRVSDGAIGDLLEAIDDAGFFNFPYQIESPVIATDLGSTFIYVNSKLAANASSAYGLGFEAVSSRSGDAEFAYYRRLLAVAERIDALKPTSGAQPYQPDTVALVVAPQDEPLPGSLRPEPWGVDTIDLAAIADGEGARVLSGEEAAAVIRAAPALTVSSFQQGNRVFWAGYRPILPFEEHFPEFDAAQP